MPPKKRKVTGPENQEDLSAAWTEPAKRQRVSLACDACRTARERCDGERPNCGACVGQNRACSYTPAAKKRGVQTGYLRTIELSLAWIFEQHPEAEEALHTLLTRNGGIDGARLLQKKDRTGNRLHSKWTKSRIQTQIACLLSNGPILHGRLDTSGEDSDSGLAPSDADAGQSSSPHARISTHPKSQHNSNEQPQNSTKLTVPASSSSSPDVRSGSPPVIRLPSNWRRLVDIYFMYTHCWLPILHRNGIMNTALAFPPDGIAPHVVELHPSYAELWAVLAIGSFQDASSSTPSNDMSPKQIYAIARDMIPSEESRFELPHLRSLLLHSVVLLGQGASLAAGILVGTAVRLALHLRTTGELYAGDVYENPNKSPGALTFAACFVLNTFTSACLGQPTFHKADAKDVLASVDAMGSMAENELWMPVLGFGSSSNHIGGPITTRPLKSLQQLYEFTRILGASLDAESFSGQYTNQARLADELVKSLDPQFSFCSSVMYGGSTPLLPSAFLLRTAFLAATIHLIPDYRASLLSSLMETMESFISNFGTCGTPPVVVGLIGMVRRCGHLDKLHGAERSRWESIMNSLTSVWKQQQEPATTSTSASPSVYPNPNLTYSAPGPSAPGIPSPAMINLGYGSTRGQTAMPPVSSTYNSIYSTLPRIDSQQLSQRPYPMQPPLRSLVHGIPPSSNLGMQFISSNTMQGPHVLAPYSNGSVNQAVDYDGILEELGSIDSTERLEADPHFMTNLGFTPGADLGEVFHDGYGVM